MEIAFILAGIVIGFIITYFSLNKKFNAYKLQINNLNNRSIILKNRTDQLLQELNQTRDELKNERVKAEQLSNGLAIKETQNQHLTEKLAQQKSDIEEMHKKLSNQFNILAQQILDDKSKKFTQQNKEQLEQLLHPLNDKLKGFEQKIEDTYLKNVKDRSDLQAEIKKLYDLNSKISQEANNLTKALKGDVKKQGNWGELILEKILENSGLQKNIEFKTQVSLSNDTGKKFMPDVIIYLPDNKHIIVDSKVSLIAYEKFVSAESSADQQVYLKEHVNAIKNHIKQLSDKAYYKLNSIHSPEYVLLFVPIESSFSIAINEDKSLFNYAWDHKIVVVSPSTLIATLLTVASIWRQENQTKNALEIAKRSGDLYDKFVGLSETLIDLGHRIKQTQNTYDSAMNKLSTGKGNLVKRAEAIKKLGAKANKNLPTELIDDQLPE